jgi:hypothetical protein
MFDQFFYNWSEDIFRIDRVTPFCFHWKPTLISDVVGRVIPFFCKMSSNSWKEEKQDTSRNAHESSVTKSSRNVHESVTKSSRNVHKSVTRIFEKASQIDRHDSERHESRRNVTKTSPKRHESSWKRRLMVTKYVLTNSQKLLKLNLALTNLPFPNDQRFKLKIRTIQWPHMCGYVHSGYNALTFFTKITIHLMFSCGNLQSKKSFLSLQMTQVHWAHWLFCQMFPEQNYRIRR